MWIFKTFSFKKDDITQFTIVSISKYAMFYIFVLKSSFVKTVPFGTVTKPTIFFG
jgi:hypothetical protein